MIVEFQIPWGWQPSAEQIESMIQLTGVPVELDTDGRCTNCWVTRRADLALAAEILGGKIEVTSVCKKPSLDDLVSKLDRVIDALDNNRDRAENELLHVYQPGIGLLTMNEVKLMQDFCTDELQGMLDEGWRILAVCPQPDTRRPDYILTRYNQDLNNT